jgi:hypothetical protein
MKNVPDSKLGNLYREHINLILKKDIDGLLAQYADDGLLISSFEKTPKYFRSFRARDLTFTRYPGNEQYLLGVAPPVAGTMGSGPATRRAIIAPYEARPSPGGPRVEEIRTPARPAFFSQKRRAPRIVPSSPPD